MDVSHECPQTLNASGTSIHEVGNLVETAKALDDERFFVNLRAWGGGGHREVLQAPYC